MVYVFDGTKNGFLTAFLAAYKDENALLTSKQTQLPLGERTLFIDTEPLRAEKAKNRLLCFDRDCMRDLDTLLRSGMDNNEQIAFRYFHTLTKEKRPIGKMLSNPDVFAAVECMRKVGFEVHRFHGFIRFMETASGALYAPFAPDNDICDLLAPHFRARLPQFPFVLHDTKRKKAAVVRCKNFGSGSIPRPQKSGSRKEHKRSVKQRFKRVTYTLMCAKTVIAQHLFWILSGIRI